MYTNVMNRPLSIIKPPSAADVISADIITLHNHQHQLTFVSNTSSARFSAYAISDAYLIEEAVVLS